MADANTLRSLELLYALGVMHQRPSYMLIAFRVKPPTERALPMSRTSFGYPLAVVDLLLVGARLWVQALV